MVGTILEVMVILSYPLQLQIGVLMLKSGVVKDRGG